MGYSSIVPQLVFSTGIMRGAYLSEHICRKVAEISELRELHLARGHELMNSLVDRTE